MGVLMITNIVTRLRTERRISKAHLARRIRVSRAYVTRLEQGTLQPSAEILFRIAAYFKRPVEEVFQHVPEEAKS